MKTKRTIRKLSRAEKELLLQDRVINTKMANTLYNLAQAPHLANQCVDSLRDLCNERDTNRNLIRPLIERLTK